MDDAPNTDDLDLGAVSTPGELAALLRTVRRRADNPSLRTLEARTRHRDPPLSKTTAASMLKGARFPRKAVMLAFLRACGIPDDKMGPWQRTWDKSHPARKDRPVLGQLRHLVVGGNRALLDSNSGG